MKDRKLKLGLFRCGYQWEVGMHKERVKEGECGGSNLYSCMKVK
jgi:hypothetical protein